MDLSIFGSFPVGCRARTQTRLEIFNLTNVTYLGAPSTALPNAAFGQQSTAQVNDPRTVQVALRLQF